MKVLIVDDDFSTLRTLRRTLRDHETLVASDVETALSIAQKQRPDAFIIDVFLGEESGIEAVEQLLAATPRALAIVTTGRPSWDLMSAAYAAGARAFVDKVDLGLMGGILSYLSPVAQSQ